MHIENPNEFWSIKLKFFFRSLGKILTSKSYLLIFLLIIENYIDAVYFIFSDNFLCLRVKNINAYQKTWVTIFFTAF